MSVKRYDMKEVFKGRMAVVETSAGAFVTHGDYSVIEQKLTNMAVQLANAESKCRELAAENSAIKVMNDCLSEEMRGYESDGAFEGPKMHLLWWKAETPATDAFLAEVQASALEYYANLFKDTVNMDVKHNQEFHKGTIYVADQIRKGAAL